MPEAQKWSGPRFTSVHSTDLDREKGDVVLKLVSYEGLQFTMKVHRAIVGSVVTALLAQAARLPRDPTGEDVQPLTLTAARKAIGPAGQPMLVLQFDGSLNVAVLLSQKSIAGLRTQLSELEALTKPPRPQSPRH
jgi:hypothetical protein